MSNTKFHILATNSLEKVSNQILLFEKGIHQDMGGRRRRRRWLCIMECPGAACCLATGGAGYGSPSQYGRRQDQ